MKTKKLLIVLLASSWLIACTSSGESKSQEQTKKDYIPAPLLQTVNEEITPKKATATDDLEALITIVYADDTEEYIHDTLLADSLKRIAKTAEKFIKWYIDDNCPIDQEKLFTFSDSMGYYIFDTIYSEYYLENLEKTGIVSDSLIRNLRSDFEQSKIEMEDEKNGSETDCCIYYEADIIFNSQDLPDPFLEPEMKIKSFDFWSSNISVRFTCGSAARLIYEKGQWKVIRGGF